MLTARKGPGPKEITATVARNHIVKKFMGEKTYAGESNPYSDTQKLTANIPWEHVDLLKEDLVERGYQLREMLWDYNDKKLIVGEHYTKGLSRIYVKYNGGVACFGPKKAKPSNIPYFD